MAGVKRKVSAETSSAKSTKKPKNGAPSKSSKPVKKPHEFEDDIVESDTTEEENGFYGFSANEDPDSMEDVKDSRKEKGSESRKPSNVPSKFANGKPKETSRESHAKQKALAKERKAAKPNADSIQRAKKLWERLRRQSHVPKEERKELVEELFGIITGRMKEFVFKHDSVRVIQCALKYASKEQRQQIAEELKGSYKVLAESRYAKFLVAKLIVEGDSTVRDTIITEFYGHVRQLINHPEASWILDDIYRGAANAKQKSLLLREWYGAEFALFKPKAGEETPTSDLATILAESPEKRKPIMQSLFHLINQLLQKQMTGFTMLHDAMLQYLLALSPGSTELTEFIALLRPTSKPKDAAATEDSDDAELNLLKNLAFTPSGARVYALVLARATAADRRHLLKPLKGLISAMAFDPAAHRVLLAAATVVDDTKLLASTITAELLGKSASDDAVPATVLECATHESARIPLLYPLAGTAAWFLPAPDAALVAECVAASAETSKKPPATRAAELTASVSPFLLRTVAEETAALTASSYGCQCVQETLLRATGDKDAAADAVAALCGGDPREEGHLVRTTHGSRMVKTLVHGGVYDRAAGKVVVQDPELGFAERLWKVIREHVVAWATGEGAFVVLAMVEAEGWKGREELVKALKGKKKELEKKAKKPTESGKKKEKAKTGKGEASEGNAGTRLLLDQLAAK